MSILTTESIVEIVNGLDVDPKVSIHPSAVEYLHQLVKPYADAIETATIEQLRDWIHAAFKGDLVDSAVDALDTYVNGLIKEEDAEGRPITPETPEILKYARETVIDVLLEEIIKDSYDEAINNGSDTIWPWDIQAILSSNKTYEHMFGVPNGVLTLPVDFIINGKTFRHEVSDDFIGGFILFTNASEKEITTTVLLFGEPFTITDIISRYTVTRGRFYTIKINDMVYGFDQPDFMQGILTAAQWADVDHHAYWTNLTNTVYTTAGDYNIEITF